MVELPKLIYCFLKAQALHRPLRRAGVLFPLLASQGNRRMPSARFCVEQQAVLTVLHSLLWWGLRQHICRGFLGLCSSRLHCWLRCDTFLQVSQLLGNRIIAPLQNRWTSVLWMPPQACFQVHRWIRTWRCPWSWLSRLSVQRAFCRLHSWLICSPSLGNASGDVGWLVLLCIGGSWRLDKLGY